MDRGGWWATVHWVTKELDMTWQQQQQQKKRLDAPTERHRLAEWIQKQTPIYAVYKRPTSDLGTHID